MHFLVERSRGDGPEIDQGSMEAGGKPPEVDPAGQVPSQPASDIREAGAVRAATA